MRRHARLMPIHVPGMYSTGLIRPGVHWRIDYGRYHLWRYYEDDGIIAWYWRRIRIPWILWATFR